MQDFFGGFSKYLEEQKRKEKKNRLGDAISSAGAAVQKRTAAPIQRSAGSTVSPTSRRSSLGSNSYQMPALSEYQRSASEPLIKRDRTELLLRAIESLAEGTGRYVGQDHYNRLKREYAQIEEKNKTAGLELPDWSQEDYDRYAQLHKILTGKDFAIQVESGIGDDAFSRLHVSRSRGARSLDGDSTEGKKWYQGWLDAGGFGKIGDDDTLLTGAYKAFKTLLATGADIGENVNAAVIDATENLIDNGASLVGNIAGWTGNYDVQDDVMGFIAEDLLKPKETGEFLQRYALGDILTPLLVGDSNDIEDYSVLGDKADNTVQSLAHNIGSRALSLVGVPWQVPTAVNAVGSTLEEAYRNGATWDEGQAAALASAGIEIGTEALFRGSGLGEKGLVNLDSLTSGIKSSLLKRAADIGVDIAAEGVEEVVAEVASNAASKIYRDESWEEIMWSEEARAGYIDALISSMISTGAMNAGNISNSVRNKTDYRTGLTENEQKVFDSIYKDMIADAEKNGKVTRRTKDEIYDKVMNDLKKGYISTETIEKVLGGESYQKYADTSKQRKELQAEYDELYNRKSGDKSDADIDRQKELQALLEKTDPTGYRKQLDREMQERLKGSYLAESYNERTRRGEAFKADASQYKNEFAQKTVKNIVDSGVVNNSNRTHDFVNLLAKISADRGLVFTTADAQKLKDTGYAIQGVTVNGVYDNGTVTLNIDSSKALNSVVGHEVVHALEGSDFYAPLRDAVVAYAEKTGEYDTRLKSLKEIYAGKAGYETDFDNKVERELVADLIGDYVFSDPDFINNLSAQNRNLFQKLYDEIKYLLKVATAGSKEARALEKVKKTFEDAYRETKNTAQPDGVKSESVENIPDSVKENSTQKNGSRSIETESIKTQLRNNQDRLNKMGIVANVRISEEYLKMEKAEKQNWVIERLRPSNYQVIRKNFGVISFAKKYLKSAFNYFKKGSAEEVVFEALPNVLESGIEITNRTEHKGRGYGTITIAAPITINGKRGNMAVTVKRTDLNHYNVHRILTPDGSVFQLSDILKETEPTPAGESPQNGSLATPIGSVSTDIISENTQDVNRKLSLSEDGGGASVIGDNVYGHDVALESQDETVPAAKRSSVDYSKIAPTAEDIAAMEQERTGQSEDGIGRLLRGLKEIGGEDSRQDPAADSRAKAEMIVGDRNTVISNRAEERYQEISSLKKGVRASKDLGYILDHGYDWQSIKTALLNIRDNPDQLVNPNSKAEQTIRKLLNADYDNQVRTIEQLRDESYSEKAIRTVKERLLVKIENYQAELEELQRLRKESVASYNDEIAELQAEYDSKKNKNTGVANAILKRIERRKRQRDNTAADYAKSINDLQEIIGLKREELRTGESASEQAAMRVEIHSQIVNNIKSAFAAKGYDFDQILSEAKNLSAFSTVDNTPQRVMEKSLGFQKGQILADLTVNQIAKNEADSIKWLNSYTDRKNGMLAKLSEKYKIKPGSKESAAAQMYAEGFWVDKDKKIIPYGDAELAADFSDTAVQKNIKGLARDPLIRQIYDETLVAINKSRVRNAYPEIQRLGNYFLHFHAMTDTFSQLGIPFNPGDIKVKDLPADLNGVTADLKPGQPYFSSSMHRRGKRTSFDLLGGLEKYLTSAKNQIYHIDDIQTLRALRNYIADSYGQAKGLENLDLLSEEEAQAKIKDVYDGHLSNFARFLNEEANVIAGKTSLIDRGVEGFLGRRGLEILNTINRQVGSNMVGYNPSSALTNLISVVQGIAKSNKSSFIKAFTQLSYNKIKRLLHKSTDGFVDKSSTITLRKGVDPFYRKPWQKAGDLGYALAGAIDNFSTELLVRTKYNEYKKKGMDDARALSEADKWVSRLMGDRSLGQQPLLYNSKTLGLFTKFQLEVRNQLDSMFYDTIQEKKLSNEEIDSKLKRNAITAAQVTSVFIQLALGQHLFGKAFESIAGYNPAFDIISVLVKALGYDDEEESEDTPLDNLEQALLELVGDLPYTSIITSGGRIPISSALPIKQFINREDQYGSEKPRWETALETVPYYFLPSGYGQIKKTVQGASMFLGDKPVTGSYTTDGKLRFEVEPTAGNVIQAGLFGQWASRNAQDYIEQGRKPLSEKKTEEFEELGISMQEYWVIQDDLGDMDTFEEKAEYIGELDLTTEQKNILINNLSSRKNEIDMEEYEQFGNWPEFDFYMKDPDKYDFLKKHGISYQDWTGFSQTKKDAWTWGYNNPEKLLLSQAVTDNPAAYRRYTSHLNDIKADKNAKGNPMPGSRQQKAFEYINALPLSPEEKMILYKTEFPSYNDDNEEIVEYIRNLDGYTQKEKETMLKELGFTFRNGRVYWD